MTRHSLFFYGSLRDPALRETVIGRAVEASPAALHGWETRAASGEEFPAIAPAPGAVAEGALVAGVTEAELARIAFFADEDDFAPRMMAVRLPGGGEAQALVFAPRPSLALAGPWRLQDWPAGDRALLSESAREIMALFEQGGASWSDDTLWPGIRARAAARLIAMRAPSPGGFAGMRPGDAVSEAISRPYASFFAVEDHRVRHRRFDGSMSPPLDRAAWISGDAVTVLPWDPATDAVLLVTQWRVGPHARGDVNPWTVEVIAGRLDDAEPPEAAARREAREEAGLTLGRMERAAAFYASPGAAAEFVTAFVAEADLSAAGGVGGLAGEAEDIRSAVLPLDEALAMAERGEVNASPALVSLLWLARHRGRLLEAWAAPEGGIVASPAARP